MRLSLSKPEVDWLVEGVDWKIKTVKDPGLKVLNRLGYLRAKLVRFRNEVWNTKYREV